MAESVIAILWTGHVKFHCPIYTAVLLIDFPDEIVLVARLFRYVIVKLLQRSVLIVECAEQRAGEVAIITGVSAATLGRSGRQQRRLAWIVGICLERGTVGGIF